MNDYEYIFIKSEEEVCKLFNIDIEEVLDKNNRKKPSIARGVLFYRLHCIHKISIGKIAKRYNRKERGVKALVAKTKFIVERQKQKEA